MLSELIYSYQKEIETRKGAYSINEIIDIFKELETKANEYEREVDDKIYDLEEEIKELKEQVANMGNE